MSNVIDLSARRRPPPATLAVLPSDSRKCFTFIGVNGVGLVIGPGPTVTPVYQDTRA